MINDPTVSPSPGQSDETKTQLTTFGMNSDMSMTSEKTPGLWNLESDLSNKCKLNILHLEEVPPQCNYETIDETFKKFGSVKEIRMYMKENRWQVWISFGSHEDAFKASLNISNIQINDTNIKGALCNQAPRHLEVYKPEDWIAKPVDITQNLVKDVKPPTWIIVTGKSESYNFYKMSKHIQKKVGTIKSCDITRYSKESVLIHAKSETQAHMLCNMNIDNHDLIKEINAHFNFSYGRGVIFDRDLYEFSENEILEMCPNNILKVNKIPGTNMIIITFNSPDVQDYIYVENTRIRVRVYIPKPMQCYKCFLFGHSTKFCRNNQICINCSAFAHGECNRETKCCNCNENHKSNNKNCVEYKNEEAALLKANAEHISIGYAKKLLGQKMNYAKAVKITQNLPNGVPERSKDPGSAQMGAVVTKTTEPPKTTKKTVDDSNPLQNNQTSQNIHPEDQIEIMQSEENLPDLPKISTPKEQRQRNKSQKRRQSSSPPSSPLNRFEVLTDQVTHEITDEENSSEDNSHKGTKLKTKKTVAEIHQYKSLQKQQAKRQFKIRPNISRRQAKSKP